MNSRYLTFPSRFELFAAIGIEDRGDIKTGGQIIRTNRIDCGRRDDSGYYMVFPTGCILAGCWSTGLSGLYLPKGGRRLSKEELRHMKAKIEAEREAARIKQEKEHSAAADLAKAVWGFSLPVNPSFCCFAYFQKKGLSPVRECRTLGCIKIKKLAQLIGYWPRGKGARLLAGEWCLVVPIIKQGRMCSLELIDGDGCKSFLRGGDLRGGSWCTQGGFEAAPVIGICEGVATALSIARLKKYAGIPVFAAMSCGNLERVAEILQAEYPNSEIIVFGDVGNGSSCAVQAAQRTYSGRYCFPSFSDIDRAVFSETIGGEPTDFNDYYQIKKIEGAIKHHAEREN